MLYNKIVVENQNHKRGCPQDLNQKCGRVENKDRKGNTIVRNRTLSRQPPVLSSKRSFDLWFIFFVLFYTLSLEKTASHMLVVFSLLQIYFYEKRLIVFLFSHSFYESHINTFRCFIHHYCKLSKCFLLILKRKG